MNLFRLTIAAFALLALLCAAPPSGAQSVEGIAALVNDRPITTVDVRNRMRLIIASTGIQPSPDVLQRIQEQALRSLIDEDLQLQAAEGFDFSVPAEDIDEALTDIAMRNNSTLEQITSELAGAGVDVATLRRQLEAEIAWQSLVSGRFGGRVRVSNQQIEQVLERLAVTASQPQYRVAEIFIEIPSAAGEAEGQARAMGALTAIQQGAAFQDVAFQFSDAPSAVNGGEIGWVGAGELRPEVDSVLRQMQPNQLSRPIRVPGGYMIVALIEQRAGTTAVQYRLAQITLPSSAVTEAAVTRLTRNLATLNGCDNLDAATAGVDGAFASSLGDVGAGLLQPQIRDALQNLQPGQNTGLLSTAAGRQAFILCGRSIGGPGVPTREDIESQLRGQQLSMLSRRWLRDLRREALIDIRL